jgi:hypothetical protein
VPRRLILLVLVAVGAGMVIWAFTNGSDQANDPSVTGSGAQTQAGGDIAQKAVEHFSPKEGDLVLRQDQVGVDLRPGWDADLIIDGKQIPRDQLDRNEPLNQVFYRPGADKEIEALDAGRTCVTALVRDLTHPEDGDHRVVWCFRVA